MVSKFLMKKLLLSLPVENKMISTIPPHGVTRRFHDFISFPYENDYGTSESFPCADWQQQFQSLSVAPEKAETNRYGTTVGQEILSQSRRSIHYNSHQLCSSGKTENQPNEITYAIVPWAHCNKVSKFLISNYHKHEPITKALEMPFKEVDGWFKRFIRKTMYVSVSDVCVEALDWNNQKRVGILSSMLYDPKLSRPVEKNFTNPTQHPVYTQINEFYDALEKDLDPIEAVGVKGDGKISPKILEHLFLSVHPDYWRQGIGSRLVALSESIASNILTCRVGYTIATSEYSYATFLKRGYKVVRECKYADYTNSEGNKIFVGREDKLHPHSTCRAMVKEFKCLY